MSTVACANYMGSVKLVYIVGGMASSIFIAQLFSLICMTDLSYYCRHTSYDITSGGVEVGHVGGHSTRCVAPCPLVLLLLRDGESKCPVLENSVEYSYHCL